MLNAVVAWLHERTTTEIVWISIGIFGQFMFTGRFLVQWIASERARRSIVPEMFWYFSLGGGLLLFAYSIYRLDPVYILGQGAGVVIYLRNLYFVWTHKRTAATASAADA